MLVVADIYTVFANLLEDFLVEFIRNTANLTRLKNAFFVISTVYVKHSFFL